MIYSCVLYTGSPLLDVKIEEELDHVDCMIIAYPAGTLKFDNPKIITVYPPREEKNPRDFSLWKIDIKDDDIIFSSDDTEINHKDDFDMMVEEVKETCSTPWGPKNILPGREVHFRHHSLYGLNMEIRSPKKNEWTDRPHRHTVGITGKLILELPKLLSAKTPPITLSGLRSSVFGKDVRTNGHAFNLIPPEEGVEVEKVEIDESYPKAILNNLDKWKEYIHD